MGVAAWLGNIIGVRVGGPLWLIVGAICGPGLAAFCNMGGLGLPGAIVGEPGEPGMGEPTTAFILGIILGVFWPLGPGGRPGPTLLPLGDIFCFDLGLGWLGKFPLLALKPVLAFVCVVVGKSGAMALDIAVLPGGAPDGMLAGLTAVPGIVIWGRGLVWGGKGP